MVYSYSISSIYYSLNLVLGEKYEAISVDSGYNKYMTLKIRDVGRSDFVSYKCVAKNSLGETDGIIKLDGEYGRFFLQKGCDKSSKL